MALRYLFLNDELHRVLQINRPKDEITLWSYPSKRRVGYTYSDVKRQMKPAFTVAEVGKILGRHKMTIFRAIKNGDIKTPQYTYGLDDPNHTIFKYMFNEDNIMEMHALLQTRHSGKPRKDGLITPIKTPTAREVRALIRQNRVFYVRTDEGFVPTWQAENF